MFALMNLDYHRLREPAVVYTALCLVVADAGRRIFPGQVARHASLDPLGPAEIQPSELAKLAVILYLAWFLDLRRRTATSLEFSNQDLLQTILPAVAPILVCVALILAQPDLGTSVDIVLIMTAILFVAGLSWKWLAVGAADGAAAALLSDHSRFLPQARLVAFLHPDNDPQGAGFQLLAIADRGWLRRIYGRRPDGKQTETFLSSGSAHGFYLRCYLRRTWLHRCRDCHRSFRDVCLARSARRL